jgi:hypothetical protein
VSATARAISSLKCGKVSDTSIVTILFFDLWKAYSLIVILILQKSLPYVSTLACRTEEVDCLNCADGRKLEAAWGQQSVHKLQEG